MAYMVGEFMARSGIKVYYALLKIAKTIMDDDEDKTEET